MKVIVSVLAVACCALPPLSQIANVVFADSFDDGIVDDMTYRTQLGERPYVNQRVA